MKTRFLFALPLAATLMLPAVAQQAPESGNAAQDQQQPAATQPAATTDTETSARQPLQPETRQGFWGHLMPFARKKYVQRQLSPIRNRVNELDDLTAANAKSIKDVDARATEGIRQADQRASLADQHALDAGNRAQMAHQTAQQASQHLQNVEQVVGNIDQYQQANQVEIRFRSGATTLSSKAKSALDDLAGNLKDQRGYVVEVQGFAPGKGQAAIAQSQREADAVVRYLVLEHQIPVYRIYVLGMGSARVAQTGETRTSRAPRVEVTLLKNGVDQLGTQQAATNPGYSQPDSMSTPVQNGQPEQQNPNPR